MHAAPSMRIGRAIAMMGFERGDVRGRERRAYEWPSFLVGTSVIQAKHPDFASTSISTTVDKDIDVILSCLSCLAFV
jgi:hypothetical protein